MPTKPKAAPKAKPKAKPAAPKASSPKKAPAAKKPAPAKKPAAKPVPKPVSKAASKPPAKVPAKPPAKPKVAPPAKPAKSEAAAPKPTAKAAPEKPAAKVPPPRPASLPAEAPAPVPAPAAKPASPAKELLRPAGLPSPALGNSRPAPGSVPKKPARKAARVKAEVEDDDLDDEDEGGDSEDGDDRVPVKKAAAGQPAAPAPELRVIRKQVVVTSTIHEVWNAFTTLEGCQGFFAPEAKVEPKPGGSYELYFDSRAPEGARGSEGCTFLSLDPPHRLAFSWNAPPDLPNVRKERTLVSLEIEPFGHGRSRVSLKHSGWKDGPEWDKAFQYFSKSWDLVLTRLVQLFERGPINWRKV